jgi:hypothetical protein
MQEFLAAIPDRHTLDVLRLQEGKSGLENPVVGYFEFGV